MKRVACTLLLVCVIFGVAVPDADAAPKFKRVLVDPAEPTGEPGVAVDNRKDPPWIYVTAPEASSQLWRSVDGGKTYRRMAATKGGSGDSDVVVDAKGTVYVSDLFDGDGNGTLPVSVSVDGGRSYKRIKKVATPGSFDRQWIESNGPRNLLVTARDLDAGRIAAWVSNDSARTFDGPFTVARDPSIGGPIVSGPMGVYYMAFSDGTGIRYAKSSDGIDWTTGTIATDHFPVLFPVIAVDDRSNLYAVWTEASGELGLGTSPVYFSRSTNRGRSWSAPRAISPVSPDAFGTTPSAVFPWIVAGSPGRVNVSYVLARRAAGPDVASDIGGPETTWDLVVAQSTNATVTRPKWSTITVNRSFHTGSICTFGILCPGPQSFGLLNVPGPFDRRHLDYFEMAVDETGRAYVSYTRDRPATSGDPLDVVEALTDVLVARQSGGTRLRP